MDYSFDKKHSILSNLKWIFSLSFRHIPVITSARLLGELINQIKPLFSSFAIGVLIDWAIMLQTEGDSIKLDTPIIIFGLYLFMSTLGSVLRNYGGNLTSFPISYYLPRKMLAKKTQELSIQTLENPQTQNVITRYNENTYNLDNMLRKSTFIFSQMISLLLSLIPVFLLLPLNAFLLVIVSIPDILLNRKFIDDLWKLSKDTTEDSRRSGGMIWKLNRPSPMKEIKILGISDYLRQYFDRYYDLYFGKKLDIYRKWILSDFLTGLLYLGISLYSIFLVIDFAVQGTISIGQITFYITSILFVGSQLANIAANTADFSGSSDRINEMRSLLNFQDGDDSKKGIPALVQAPKIELKNISFSYPNSDKRIIKDVSLTINPGEKIAIVGQNGAGKTTLVKLISNIYDVSKGEIQVNGQRLDEIRESSWFKNLGILFQDFNTYEDLTVEENIALGRIEKEIDMDGIVSAAKKADAHSFIMDYPNGYKQILSEKYEGGIRPSTGQWQKIAIARFFYRNAPLLILDEPTAAIDAVAEAAIFDRIYEFIEEKTVIIISHRFSTVRNADRIIVFEDGEIIEEGSHDQLMKKNGKYANAFKLQAKGYSKKNTN